MQGGKLFELLDLGNNVLVYQNGAVEILAAVHDTVAYRGDFLVGGNRMLALGERAKNQVHCGGMVGQGLMMDDLVIVDAMLVGGVARPHLLA